MATEQKNDSLDTLLKDATITNKKGDAVTIASLKEFDVLGFYFSAHWCPPCRRFTPMLAKAYANLKKDNNNRFEIIFVSSDRDESSYNSYYDEVHPWNRLSWAYNSANKSRLGSTLESGSGIPSLVLIDPKTGETITKKGTEGFWGNESGAGFPFKPRSIPEILQDGADISKKKTAIPYADLMKYDYTILYFSAHWCPPCRAFTPKFVEWYNNNQSKMPAGKTFEVVFCSSDKSEDQYNEYYGEMPWATLSFEDKRTAELKRVLEVEGIPSVKVIRNKTGLEAEPKGCGGRSGVENDPKAEKFPWPKEPASNFMGLLDAINERPCVIVLAGKKDDKLFGELTAAATPYLQADGSMEVEFGYEDGSTPPQLLARVKGLFKIGDGHTVLVSDLGKGQFHKPASHPKIADIDKAYLDQLVADFKAGKLQTATP